MASFPVYATGEMRTTGSNANGGFFDSTSAGTDYSQQNSAQLSVTDAVTNGTATVTSATGGFTSAMVGNGVNIAGKIFVILTVASSTSITVTTNAAGSYPTTATGQTAKVGGAVLDPGYAASQMAQGNWLWIQQGTYVITSDTSNTAGGYPTWPGGVGGGREQRVQGYKTTRGDVAEFEAPPAIFKAGANLSSLGYGTYGLLFRFVQLDGQDGTWTAGGMDLGGGRAENVWVSGCGGYGLQGSGWAYRCYGTKGRNGAACFYVQYMEECWSEAQNNQTGFGVGSGGIVRNCVCVGNGYNAGLGSNGSTAGGVVEGCVFLNMTSYVGNPSIYVGFAGGQRTWKIRDCLFLSCDSGIKSAATESTAKVDHCGFYNVTTPLDTGIVFDASNNTTLTANPFSTFAFGNIKLSTAGAAALYAAGINFPSSWLASAPGSGGGGVRRVSLAGGMS